MTKNRFIAAIALVSVFIPMFGMEPAIVQPGRVTQTINLVYELNGVAGDSKPTYRQSGRMYIGSSYKLDMAIIPGDDSTFVPITISLPKMPDHLKPMKVIIEHKAYNKHLPLEHRHFHCPNDAVVVSFLVTYDDVSKK